MIHQHPAYIYCSNVVSKTVPAPKYVIKQAIIFLKIADGHDKKYVVDLNKLNMISNLLKLLVMAKGLKAGNTVYDSLAGFQWFLIVAVLCIVHRGNMEKRRYEKAILEICRKNGKTFLVAVIMILLFFTEPRFSKFYSVAPDGALSREVKEAIEQIIACSPATNGMFQNKMKFKIRRDDILCQITQNDYVPLNYSNSRLDGKLPSVFLVDEVGALPNSYAIEAMGSGQLTIKNKLGFVISTKYPRIDNPFEDEVDYAKKVLDGLVDDEKLFSLLYEPDNQKDWSTDNTILQQANPLAVEMPAVMDDLIYKRSQAVEMESKRENFITKHCNICYSGMGTESYVSVADLQKGRREQGSIDWQGRSVYVGMDLAMTNDNCAIAMVAWDSEKEEMLVHCMAFVPEDRIPEKNRFEKINYDDFCRNGTCISCGNNTVDYAVIEAYVLELEAKFNVKILGVGFDRYNALSSAQKIESGGYPTVEIKQHSSVLHPATKWVAELIADGKFIYTDNRLLEINFQNARCLYDTNLNRYVTKKKSKGKVDEVAAIIDAAYLLQQDIQLNNSLDWVVQI